MFFFIMVDFLIVMILVFRKRSKYSLASMLALFVTIIVVEPNMTSRLTVILRIKFSRFTVKAWYKANTRETVCGTIITTSVSEYRLWILVHGKIHSYVNKFLLISCSIFSKCFVNADKRIFLWLRCIGYINYHVLLRMTSYVPIRFF